MTSLAGRRRLWSGGGSVSVPTRCLSMPIQFALHPSRPVRIVSFVGSIDDELLYSAFETCWKGRGYDPSLAELDDLSAVTGFTVTSGGILRMSKLAVEMHVNGGARTAIYAPTDLAFGLSRMYEILIDESPDRYRVFRDLLDARRWVGLD
jgi:hypothetical protein